MQKGSVEAIVRELNANQVRYLIVGGLAVVAHGYVRFTADVDIFLDLDVDNVERAVAAFKRLGYQPRAPVPLEAFADFNQRTLWISEKGLTVFSLFSPDHPLTEVDLFVEAPLDFDRAYQSAEHKEVTPGLEATFIGFDDLVVLKTKAGRYQDLQDIERLQAIKEKPPSE